MTRRKRYFGEWSSWYEFAYALVIEGDKPSKA